MEAEIELDVEALVARWRGPLVGLIASWGVPWGEAAELAQDALAEAYLARGRFRGDPNDAAAFGPWLRGIAFNLHRNRTRARARSWAEPLGAQQLPAAPGEGADDGDGALAELRAAVERLPGPLATVVRMHYLEETAVRDVAALLGVPEKTVEGRLYRARAELRRLLGADVGAGRAGEGTR